ncbi:hypothetical protein PS2015_2684 [Pseudohongiella spirulinae]|uniref:Uncharacterized protein n=2 Tax=Pseudohongiella spirulinae TaxID=1249552 RepID=A0A0S2KH02_9GAMM|nr:hypothetical protein PS2015_2684 [Pseudohongiella spirulinae]
MFSAARIAHLSPLRYRLLCFLPAMILLCIGLIIVLGGHHWQRGNIQQALQRHSGSNELIREELQKSMLHHLGQLPMMHLVMAINGVDEKESYRGDLLTRLHDIADVSGPELQSITDIGDPAIAAPAFQLELTGRFGQLVAYLQALSVHLKSLQNLDLAISRERGQSDQFTMTVNLSQEVLHLMRTSPAAVSPDKSDLGFLLIDGTGWRVLRKLDGTLRLQELGP